MRAAALAVIMLTLPGCDLTPGVIRDFCARHFHGEISPKGGPFNPGDVVIRGVPNRRIIDYAVTSASSWLWYEHGGRGYHQHLVYFHNMPPGAVVLNYAFDRSPHADLYSLIEDEAFLKQHVQDKDEL